MCDIMLLCIQVCFRLLFRMKCGGKIYFGNKNLNEEEVIMKNKKKNVFLAGLMVLMMIVSLLSGMNLSVQCPDRVR